MKKKCVVIISLCLVLMSAKIYAAIGALGWKFANEKMLENDIESYYNNVAIACFCAAISGDSACVKTYLDKATEEVEPIFKRGSFTETEYDLSFVYDLMSREYYETAFETIRKYAKDRKSNENSQQLDNYDDEYYRDVGFTLYFLIVKENIYDVLENIMKTSDNMTERLDNGELVYNDSLHYSNTETGIHFSTSFSLIRWEAYENGLFHVAIEELSKNFDRDLTEADINTIKNKIDKLDRYMYGLNLSNLIDLDQYEIHTAELLSYWKRIRKKEWELDNSLKEQTNSS